MHRFRRFDGTPSTLNAQLFANESIIQDQDGVGLYDGKEKDAAHDNGRLYLTSHRLIYLDAARPHYQSCDLDLSLVRQTEYWAGFIKSSPKITLLLGDVGTSLLKPPNGASEGVVPGHQDDQALLVSGQSWICRVCGFSNGPTAQCGLCGVRRDKSEHSVGPSRSPTPNWTPPAVAASTSSTPSPGPSTPRKDGLIACAVCTYLNHPSMNRCEMCESSLANASPISSRPATPSSASRIGGDTLPSNATFVRLSFRKGGEKTFYANLKKTLLAKAWDHQVVRKRSRLSGSAAGERPGDRMATIGIDGLLKTIDLDAREREDEMQEALQDLNALMAKAKEMVNMAQTINARLSSQADDASATLVRTSLVSLGLPTPAVTPDMVAEERSYHLELAKELAGVLSRSRLVIDRGLVSLDEVWCHWNRARGLALVSPRDLRQVCPFLPAVTGRQPIVMRQFRSGLCVLHTPRFSDEAFSQRVLPVLNKTTLEIARLEGLSASLTDEMMETLEMERGQVCRDAGLDTRWWPNLIQGYVWHDVN